MSNHKNLVFFNKEGDYLNFIYNDTNDRFEGDILFHENSTDTFKTFAVYTLEDIPSFEFEVPGELTTKKFQLFNEYGFHFYGAKYSKQSVYKIEPVNNDPDFYTKWIYGDGFDAKFPIGSIIQFDNIALEFTDLTQTYVVVSAKPGAIMLLTQMDNATFESSFYYQYIEPEVYQNLTISGLNAFGVYDYIDSTYNDRLARWNESDFYSKYYVKKKLNVLGSKNNDGIFTVKDVNLTDLLHYEYSVKKNQLPTNTDLIMEVITRTDVPMVYQGPLEFTSNYKITISEDYPQILKPGVEFKVVGSINNTNFFTVEEMPVYTSINNVYYFATGSQVLFNNRVFECLQSYTQSFGDVGVNSGDAFITPENVGYWTNKPTYIKVKEGTTPESLLSSQIYLTTDRYYFGFGWTFSAETTLASAAEKYKTDLETFNIDLFYLDGLRADLMYPSKYAYVNFYHTQVGPTYSIGSTRQTFERLVEVQEKFNYELNYDYSVNKKYNIVFTDIDEYGVQIGINKMMYDEEAAILYSGSQIDMERTIDRTLRNWLSRWYMRLFTLGITCELKYTGSFTSVFYNTIQIRTTYPNVPMNIDYIRVGTTADFYIEHTKIKFTDLGPYLNIKINDKDYGQSTIYTSGNTPDIAATLKAWHEQHVDFLIEFGIQAKVFNTIIRLDIKSLIRLDVVVNTGKLNLPGLFDYKITKNLVGNDGVLVASNEVVLPSTSEIDFERSGFATGMAFTINNTVYPWVNQDYTIQLLDPQTLNLSYQGPFWELGQKPCDLSGFMTLAFDQGFGQTDCTLPVGPTGATGATGPGGPFDPDMFDPTMFTIIFNANGYTLNTYDFSSYPGTTNLVDIKYIQLVNSIYGFGDNLIAIDALYGNFVASVDFVGNTQSIEMEFNPLNSYLYCLSKEYLWVVDTTSNVLISSVTFSGGALAYDLEINPFNGDVYVTYENKTYIDIWDVDNTSQSPTATLSTTTYGKPGAMVFNEFEGDMYVTCGSHSVIRISGGEPGDDFTGGFSFPGNPNRVIQTSYGIPNVVKDYIFYEPVNEAVYVYGGTNLWKIDNGLTQSMSLTYSGFSDIIFNNVTGEMNISDASSYFTRLNLSLDAGTQLAVGNYGHLAINQYDGDIYMSSQGSNSLIVLQGSTGLVVHSEPMSAPTGKLVYNPERKSVWAIQPSTNTIIEMEVEVNLSINPSVATYSEVGENLYGTLSPDYVPKENMWLKTRQYFRRPRENFEGDVSVQYYWKWMTDQVSDFFLYDFTGDQLPITGPYAYTGPKPLTSVVLNKTPNKDLYKLDRPEYQQTIFDKVEYNLSYIDDEDDVTVEAQSMELFIGYKSDSEGAIRNVLQLYKKEEIEFDIDSDSITNITFETLTNNNDKRGLITINADSPEIFTGRGLKPGHHLIIYITDSTNSKKQYISNNNAIMVKVRDVFTNYLVVDFFNINFDDLEKENTVISNYPKFGNTTYLKVKFKVKDLEIGRFIVYGETTEEDERFKIELGNIGKLIAPNEVFIFKEYDILEGGIDWRILNTKRKEMLMNRNLIYPYIGSYKSLINAINYFGYNDLQLNEYYRNIDGFSKDFGKLFKVEIPDIFDNTIKGWNEKDFLLKYLPNDGYEETNMFNLTYFITDKEGNYILNYSIDEIIIKLQGLKYWLKRNIIPLTHKIMDITGVGYFIGSTSIQHTHYDTRIFNMKEDMSPVTFKLNEAYLSPVNSGSTVYNCVLDFYSIIPGLGTELDPVLVNGQYGFNYQPLPKPHFEYKNNLVTPDTFDVKIRTYKLYKEWVPYVSYSKGDKVSYYDKLYISTKDNNKINNPRKYETAQEWTPVTFTEGIPSLVYEVGTIVSYKREFYAYSGLGDDNSTLTPEFDPANWFVLTDWREIDNEPVQYITEFRSGDDLKPFNFTLDSNIDPFVVVEVTSHSGYGQIYMDKKNYQIKGIKDLREPYEYLDPIGPFIPITPIEQIPIPGGGGVELPPTGVSWFN
jgi:hypothetical protein